MTDRKASSRPEDRHAPRLEITQDGSPLSDSVYETLRTSICVGDYPAGSRLVQDQLAADLGVSRTPIREALTRLARDGYVRRVPGSGFVVRSPRTADVAEVFQVRRSLEPLALRLAFDNLQPHDLSLLRRLDAEAQLPSWSSIDYHASNRRLHLALIDRCPNRLLVRIIEELWDLPVMQMMSHDYVDQFRNAQSWHDEHSAILEAIEKDDLEEAVRRLERHLDDGAVEAGGN